MWTACGLKTSVHIKEDNMANKTLSKRHRTNSEGVYYKEIVSDDNKIVDKIYLIRWRDENGKERLKTIGRYSEGIREAYCKAKRDEIIVKIRLDEDLPRLAKKKSITTFDTLAYTYFNENMTLVKDMPKV